MAEIKEKTDSIELSKTSTGKHSWSIKCYSFDLLKEGEANKVISKLEAINETLQKKYGDSV